jgi:hypothetical protein
MSILSDFEDRVGGALEGMFAGVFRSPVQPVEIARALGKAMDDGRSVGVGRVYAPVSYIVALSPEDADNFGGFLATLEGELATFLADHARERGYRLHAKPDVEFIIHEDLRLGRFRVSADLEPVEEPAEAPLPRSAEAAPLEAPATFATVTVGVTDHDVALHGERVLVGRLRDCDICLTDANASRKHAQFLPESGGGWAIEDLESSNGTFVNGNRVSRASLHDADVIEIGLTRLTFHQRGR